MCRLFGLIARRPVKITFPLLDAAESLRRQSLLNPDGWGVGYYAGGHAVVRKQAEAAHGSPGFNRVAEQARSHLFVAHVRLRTAGGINLANTHPFSYGGWILAQNGGIGGAWHKRIKAEIGWGRIAGKTSGEHLLYWLHARAGHLSGPARDAAILAAVRELVADPASIGSANFVLATGDQLYAFRFSPPQGNARSLFYLRRTPPPHEASSMADEASGPAIPRTPAELVASEQVTGPGEPWQPVANGCLLIAHRDLSVDLERILAA
jgi:predicted glutamine amidotransferase